MRAWLTGGLAAAMIAPTVAFGAPRLEIKAAAARVTIIPEARADIHVDIIQSRRALPLRLVRSGGVTVVDGGLARRVRGCPRLADGTLGVRVRGLGNLSPAELPRLVVRTPLDARVTVGDGVSGDVDRAASLEFENRGCGDWTIANVRGRLRLDQLGSGTAKTGRAGQAVLNVAGGGEIEMGPVGGPVTAISTGEGTIVVASVDGPVIARVAGSGGIEIAGGRASELNAQVAGSGSILFDGEAGAVAANVMGPGVVRVARALGPVSRRVFGAGRVQIGP
ncbi:MAG: GIN domain-containing protein [Caulobacteraceae bacterium]